MPKPIVVSIPHRLGREEAVRRLKTGFQHASTNFAGLLTISEQIWCDNRLTFCANALGQQASGLVDVHDDSIRIQVSLPWLLGKIAEKLIPAIRREGTLMLEKK